MSKTKYYILKLNNEIKRLAKIEDGALAYGYEGGKWVSMPSLLKIQNDITDFEDISEDEANKIIKELE